MEGNHTCAFGKCNRDATESCKYAQQATARRAENNASTAAVYNRSGRSGPAETSTVSRKLLGKHVLYHPLLICFGVGVAGNGVVVRKHNGNGLIASRAVRERLP